MSTRRAITFDFHNTLVSCDAWFELEVRGLPAAVLGRLRSDNINGALPSSAEAVTATYRQLRGEIIDHGIEMDAVSGVTETYRRLGLSADAAAVSASIDELMRDCLEEVRAMPGAVETVTDLHREGIPLGIVSSAVHHDFLLWALAGIGLLDCFETVVTSASAGFYKSRPEIYLRALGDLGVEPTSTCHVGDSARWDHGMAKSLGMRTVLITTSVAHIDGDGVAPDLTVSTLLDSSKAIAKIAGIETGSSVVS